MRPLNTNRFLAWHSQSAKLHTENKSCKPTFGKA